MKKKWLITTLTAIVLAVTSVGCAKDTGNETTTANGTTQISGEETGNTGNGEFTYPMNFEGNLTYWMDVNTSVSANYANLGETPLSKEWVEKTGVGVTYLHPPAGQQKEQFSLVIADGDLPDLMEYSWYTYPGGPQKAIKDGNIIALNEVFEKYCPNITAYLKENPDIDKMIKTDAGDYYVFPFIRGDESLLNTTGLMVRGDWLEELNLEMPTTIDEWYTVLKTFKEKKGATAPFSYEYTNGTLIAENPFMYAYNASHQFYLDKDGTIHYGATEPGYKEYLTTFSKWYKEGLIDPDLATLALDQVSAKMTNGDAGASVGWVGSRMGVWTHAGMTKEPNFTLVAAPYPTVVKGEKPEMGQIESPYPSGGSVAITTSCKDIEAAARLLDYGYGEEGHMLFNFGIEGESYTMIDDYPTYTDEIITNPKGWPLAQSLSAYIRGNYSGPFVQDKRYLEQYFTLDAQKEAIGIWAATNAAAYKIPPATPNEDESKEFSTIMNEINTYRDEMTLKFIFGTESLDNFDNYVKTIESLGLERALEIQNTALERYNNR